MSRHWRPDESVVRPFPKGKRLKSLDEFAPSEVVGRMRDLERQLPVGAKAGLVLIAAACVGVAIGLYQAFGPRDVIAPGAEAEWDANRSATMK